MRQFKCAVLTNFSFRSNDSTDYISKAYVVLPTKTLLFSLWSS